MAEISYRVVRSRRKTISIQITPDAQVVVRSPMGLSSQEIDRFVRSKSDWIEKHLKNKDPNPQPIAHSQILALADRASQVIPERVRHFARLLGVRYGTITIRNQKTRWGSCTAEGNLNFNCLLMLAPPEVLDYVVIHELCHRLEMNHSARFWAQVERLCPDYRTHRRWLKEKGTALVAGMLKKP